METVRVSGGCQTSVARFLKLGRAYLSEAGPPEGYDIDRHLQAIVTRTKRNDHWLLIAVQDGEDIGFVEAALEEQRRPGLGFISEFYVIPSKRGVGWGRSLFTIVMSMLRDCGANKIWLRTDEDVKGFWKAFGFVETGDTEYDQEVMILSA